MADAARVSASTEVAASASAIFAVLADPRRHGDIDGSGTIRRCVHGPTRLSLGSEFVMAMRLWGIPYRVHNRVVEFEENRLIAWRHFEPQHWRFELDPTDSGTCVTETFDYSYWPRLGRFFLRLLGWPQRNTAAIARTLDRLAATFQSTRS